MTVAITGIGVGSGVKTAIGHVTLLTHGSAHVEPRWVLNSEIEAEVQRFSRAIDTAEQQLHDIRKQIPDDTPEDILAFLDTHLLMLADKAISEAPAEIIRREGCSAEWALQLRRDAMVRVFEEMEDPYLRTRKDDLDHVVNRIQKILLCRTDDSQSDLQNTIVLAEDLTPADAILLHHKGALGFVTEFGSSMSHTAILARSLGIPTLVGAHGATHHIHAGELVVLDALHGVLLADCDAPTIDLFKRRRDQEQARNLALQSLLGTDAVTRDGYRLQLQANIELTEDVAAANANGAEGIGLYRTEFMYMNRLSPPNEEEHFQAYLEIVNGLPGMPVTIRTLDLGADKQCEYNTEMAPCSNPALGLRAIRLCLKEPDIFRTQIRAILRVSAFGSVSLMIPMLTNIWEARQARAIIDDEARNLEQQGIEFDRRLQVGAMIETPAAALAASSFARHFDFLSIGTNDLIQYTLAVDRADDSVNHLYDPLHPAVLRLIKQTIDAGNNAGKPVAMCGEMAGDPVYIPLLVGMGLEIFSMQPGSLLEAKQCVQQLDYRTLRERVDKILARSEFHDVENEITELQPASPLRS